MAALRYSARASRDIARLDPVVRERLDKSLLRFADDPLKFAKALKDVRPRVYRFRIGNFRAIFYLRGEIVYILRVGHRREIYR